MKNDHERLKELYTRRILRGETGHDQKCPREQEIFLFFDPGTPRKGKLETVDHISNCPSCARLFQFLVELNREQNELATALKTVSKKNNPAFPFTLPWRQLLIPVISLMLVAAISMVIFLGRGGREPGLHRTAGTQIHLFEPQGEISVESIVFRWEKHAEAESYILEICNEAMLPVWRSEKILSTEFVLPPAVTANLAKGKSHFWMVTAYSQQGKIGESSLLKFSIRAGS